MPLRYVSHVLAVVLATTVLATTTIATATPSLRHGVSHMRSNVAQLSPLDDARSPLAEASREAGVFHAPSSLKPRDIEEMLMSSSDLRAASRIALDAVVGMMAGYYTDLALLAALLTAASGLRRLSVDSTVKGSSPQPATAATTTTPGRQSAAADFSREEKEMPPGDACRQGVLPEKKPEKLPAPRTSCTTSLPATPPVTAALDVTGACKVFSMADNDSDAEEDDVGFDTGESQEEAEQGAGEGESKGEELAGRVRQDLETMQRQLALQFERGIALLEKSGKRGAFAQWDSLKPEQRLSVDGKVYTRAEFTDHFGLGEGVIRWVQAPRALRYSARHIAAVATIQAWRRNVLAARVSARRAERKRCQQLWCAKEALSGSKSAVPNKRISPERLAKQREFRKKLQAAGIAGRR
eukprot:TRINITY_DN92754_c0_g1_i1.p1 TRINITY_DN92754_c0_g1~~TRINITY_DN92754_c0_g1_i1.p1  ORF type:complete len:411 (+),score=82.56 TRINITY_DN92754_c0_g1_i1:108-1340(+)